MRVQIEGRPSTTDGLPFANDLTAYARQETLFQFLENQFPAAQLN